MLLSGDSNRQPFDVIDAISADESSRGGVDEGAIGQKLEVDDRLGARDWRHEADTGHGIEKLDLVVAAAGHGHGDGEAAFRGIQSDVVSLATLGDDAKDFAWLAGVESDDMGLVIVP